jgi:nucleoside phosphorylase
MGEGLADFVIITALREELDAILEKLPSPQRLAPTDEDVRIYYQVNLPVTMSDGTTGVYRLVLLSLLGMGRVQAANATNDAIRKWRPSYVLLVGIAGGIADAGVQWGDVIISDQIVDYELQKLTHGSEQIRWEPHRADPRLLEAARHLGGNWYRLIKKQRPLRGRPRPFIGPIATGDKVIAIKEVLDRFRSDWPKLIGIEMEAGGVASAAFQAVEQPGFLMIRGVSDLADEHKDDTWRRYACHAAAAYTLALLQSGPVPFSNLDDSSDHYKEKYSPATEIAKVHAYIYSQEAEDAMRHGNWELADAKTRQALQKDPGLNLRRTLGLQMADSICQLFIKQHRRGDGSSLQDELFFYRNPSISLIFAPAPTENAIFWLKEAQKHGEDQDGAISVAFAQLYGIKKKCATMLEAVHKAIHADPEWKESFRKPNSLILLVNGCMNEPNIQDALERLYKDLSLPHPEEAFTRYIKERYGKVVGFSLYWVIGRSDYWIEHKESMPNFPLDISVSPNKEGDVWQAEASYIVPGNREYIPKQHEYLSVHDLYTQLEKRFFLICPIE